MTMLAYLNKKIVAPGALSMLLMRWRLKGKSIVFTNGVYDILHIGHVTLLCKAAELGDVLIVGLNADESVRQLHKGPERPINHQADRAAVLSALIPVSAVVIFEEPTPFELISRIQPDILVKGGDYDPAERDVSSKKYIVGSDLQRQRGAQTVAIPLVEGYSTTAVVQKLKS